MNTHTLEEVQAGAMTMDAARDALDAELAERVAETLTPEPATPNRAQRRAAKKAGNASRARRMGRKGCDGYIRRAKNKARGMVYRGLPVIDDDGELGIEGRWHFPITVAAPDRRRLVEYIESTPQQWRITATARFDFGDGDPRIDTVEQEVGQWSLLGELSSEWAKVREAARADGNPRYLVSELIELRPLV